MDELDKLIWQHSTYLTNDRKSEEYKGWNLRWPNVGERDTGMFSVIYIKIYDMNIQLMINSQKNSKKLYPCYEININGLWIVLWTVSYPRVTYEQRTDNNWKENFILYYIN